LSAPHEKEKGEKKGDRKTSNSLLASNLVSRPKEKRRGGVKDLREKVGKLIRVAQKNGRGERGDKVQGEGKGGRERLALSTLSIPLRAAYQHGREGKREIGRGGGRRERNLRSALLKARPITEGKKKKEKGGPLKEGVSSRPGCESEGRFGGKKGRGNQKKKT